MISIIIPAYNEADKLEECISRLKNEMQKCGENYEIIVAEDGSTDNTFDIAKKIAKRDRNIRVLHFANRLGRGLALKRALRKTNGRIIIYTDADLSTEPKYVKDLIRKIDEGYDIVTGSRNIKNSITKRSLKRTVASLFYNFLVRVMFGTGVHDMQCGFKAFKRRPLLRLSNEVADTYWFWDSEILIRALREDYKVAEIAVKWDERKESKVRLISDTLYFVGSLVRLRLRL